MGATVGVVGHRYLWIGEQAQEDRDASELYRRVRGQALWSRLSSALTGRKPHLLSLAAVEANCSVADFHDAGTRTVAIHLIRGSANRCCNFDANFRPLHSHGQARWLGLAAARQRGVKLPPVELIEAAGVYFVVDGHHRVSVARALGETAIQAKVTTWQVAGPFAWEGINCRGRSRC
jgi:hypothetical protein